MARILFLLLSVIFFTPIFNYKKLRKFCMVLCNGESKVGGCQGALASVTRFFFYI